LSLVARKFYSTENFHKYDYLFILVRAGTLLVTKGILNSSVSVYLDLSKVMYDMSRQS
jgi:hypothetical protein